MSSRYSKESFFARMVPQANGCIHWPVCTAAGGYGQISYKRRRLLVHRLVWELANGAIKDGFDVMHTCDNPACCNIKHLRLGTHDDNMRDMKLKGRAAKKLSPTDVLAIRKAFADGLTHLEIAGRYNVGRRTVGKIITGDTWSWV